MKPGFYKYFIGLSSILISLSCNQTNESVTKISPNVILIVADDQGWGDISYNGNKNLKTPNIDKIAKNGVIFDSFYVSPVCSPTRAEILTGRYAPRSGVFDTSAGGERMDLDETTLADIFKKADYKTAAFGKWHNGTQYPYHPIGRGFDEFYGFCSGHWGNYFDPILEHNGKLTQGTGYLTDDITNKAIQFINQNKDDPFFLYLPFNTPHSPMQVPDSWWNKYDDTPLTQPSHNADKENVMFTKAALAMCENIDWNVGRVLKTLKELSLEENTIIIYMSDNGPNGWRWNANMKGIKGSTDEGGVRSPFFLQWKGTISPGRRVEKISAAIDILPTLIDLTGIKHNETKKIDGRSLLPLIFDNDLPWSDRHLYSYWANRLSVRNQRFRLDAENQLYDMENDIGQMTNLASKFPEIHQELLKAKTYWYDNILSELPAKDTRPFLIGHPDFLHTQIPAGEGIPFGNIKRSNQYPNCSFFTNWKSVDDEIKWDIEVVASGVFEVTLYYTCSLNNVGSTIELNFGKEKLESKINQPHDPPLIGMENDRVPRKESYIKYFKPLILGNIFLHKGKDSLTLRAVSIPSEQVMDLSLITFSRIR